MRRAERTGVAAALAAVLALFVLAPAASATVFTVNSQADPVSPDGVCDPQPGGCTLRDATIVATGVDSITLPTGTYIVNAQLGELDLNGADLNGAGARTTIIDGGDATRVLATQDDGANTPAISGVTIRRGRALGVANTNVGGGVQVTQGTLALVNSQVLSSGAQTDGGGIGLQGGARLFLLGSTVAGNTSGGNGGGISTDNEGLVAIANSTISGNAATGAGGGMYGGGSTPVSIGNATIASNTAATAGGLFSTGATGLSNTIVAGNSGAECAITGTVTSNNSLSEDATCGLAGNGNLTGVDPGLGPLTDNGGQTDTRAIAPPSVAVNAGGAQCQTADQRGIARPQGGACDIGAFEYVTTSLTVIKRVVNDQGGTQAADDFSVHVRSGSADVGGSPQPGATTGRTYVLAPGTFTVGEDPDSRYTASFSGDCTAAGVVTLAEGQAKTCTITNRDDPPVVGKVINAKPKRGTIRIKLPGRKRFRELKEGEQLPVGTTVDTRKGRVTLFSAKSKKGKTSHADFYDGIFKLGQTKGKKPITVLTLVEKLTGCKTSGKASTAAKKKRKRRLWGDGKGDYRTKGKHQAATIVGTKWLIEDRCNLTLTKVVRGRVKVRDFVKKKTVIVKAGKRYITRAP